MQKYRDGQLRTIAKICTKEWIGRVPSPFVIQHPVHEGAEEVERTVLPVYINAARKPPRTTAAGTTRAWHWAEVAPLVRPGMTLPPELELAVVVASVAVTAVTVTLGGEMVVPAATDVTTIGVFVVVTFGAVEETTIGVTAVVAPPDEVLTLIAGRAKAEQVPSKAFKTRQKRTSHKRMDETPTADQLVRRGEHV